MSMMKTLMVGIALSSLSVSAAGQDAGEAVKQSTSVQYDDLDLSSEEGQQTLDSRIDAAARAICFVDRTGSRIVSREEKKCLKDTVRSVRRQIDAVIASRERASFNAS